MNWIDRISNNDCVIEEIKLFENEIVLLIRLWNGSALSLRFVNYYGLRDRGAAMEDIGDIIVQEHSPLLDELERELVAGGDQSGEISKLKCFTFMSAWDDRVLLEILAEKALVVDGFGE